jgi:hypothetical protein
VLEHLIRQRLVELQRKHNFHPDMSLSQINGATSSTTADFGLFKGLVGLLRESNSSITIPYDPSGGTSDTLAEIRASKHDYVYFFQSQGSSTWKIGHSVNPSKRKKTLQAGHDVLYVQKHLFEGGEALEKRVHHYLRKYRVHGGGKECFQDIPEDVMQTLLKLIRTKSLTYKSSP